MEENVQDIRRNWAIADAKRDEGLVTPVNIKRYDNISYGPYGDENLMDIYVEKSVSGKQATIVNVHGGAWVYGCKEVYQYYCMSLAERGFTVVNINYRLAPESIFPAALEDLNEVIKFIETKGEQYYIDKEKVFLVGDSAGAQIVSHYAAILTNQSFAKLFNFKLPSITIKGLGLNCGAYDTKGMVINGLGKIFLEYIGCKSKEPDKELLDKIDVISNITRDFPPSYIVSSEHDFLKSNAKPMYELLSGLGVRTKMKIYGAKDKPEIGHVFHVNIRLDEARLCNDEEWGFLTQGSFPCPCVKGDT